MKIENFIERDWDETIATFDLVTNDGFKIKDCRLRKGKRGFFTSMPAEKRDGKWYDSVSTNEELNEKVTKMALEELNTDSDIDDFLEKATRYVPNANLDALRGTAERLKSFDENILEKMQSIVDDEFDNHDSSDESYEDLKDNFFRMLGWSDDDSASVQDNFAENKDKIPDLFNGYEDEIKFDNYDNKDGDEDE